MDLSRLYEFRFRDVDQDARDAAWAEIGPWLYDVLGRPARVLDPAAGRCEFINSIDAQERWIVDLVDHDAAARDDGVIARIGDIFTVDLPAGYFDGVMVSNFLEHLASPPEVARFLEHMHGCLASGGRIAVMGPNFRYVSRRYFDCADHVLPLTHVSVSEHLYAAGFEVERVVKRFIPYSFQTRLPVTRGLVRAYLALPIAWSILGQQFVVVGRRP